MKNPVATASALACGPALVAAFAALPIVALAQDTLHDCLAAASGIQAGDFVKLEYLDPSSDGRAVYEIELRADDGREWEFMCDADTGRIVEIEQEAAAADDPLFRAAARVSVDQARETVLQLYPGEIKEVEYEIESNGDPSYEMDVVTAGGTEFKIEVDATTGRIIEVAVERWEIGEEADERD